MYKQYIKRILDVVLSGLALLILSPVFLLIAVFVKVFMGSPVLFRQERTGKDEKRFYILKFRTMTDKRDESGRLLPNEERKCAFGNLLRSTSLDELPELWNIFVGDMSIIGPRPLHVSYLPYYKENERDRNTIRGGLVPPEVLSMNLTPSWDEQLEAEASYARNLTFMIDFKIFFSTFVVLYKRMRYGYGEYDRGDLQEERERTREEVIV